ncbi:MAG: hypothetical protein AAGE52_29100 [Myxococcota bacterium]
MRRRWLRRGLWALGVIVGLSGCVVLAGWWWLRVPSLDVDFPTARERFTRVLNGEDALEAEALSSLAGAVEREPENATAHLWYGLANLHGFLRHRERPYAIRATIALERAVKLDPEDKSAEGWRAFFAYKAAESREQDLDEPRHALLAAADADPRFTPFLAAVSLAKLPLSSGHPARLLPPLEAIEDCGDGTSHRCRTSALFPHGAEGYHVTVGDLRLRLGDLSGARRAWQRALEMESAATWPYRDEFRAWADGAEDRHRRWTDGDGANDPTVFFAHGERACAMCHRR